MYMATMFDNYQPGTFFDEAFCTEGDPRTHYSKIVSGFDGYGAEEFGRRRALIDLTLRNQGITFTVYGDEAGTERTFSLRPLSARDSGGRMGTFRKGAHPARPRLETSSWMISIMTKRFLKMRSFRIIWCSVTTTSALKHAVSTVPHRAYTHIVGCDLIRDFDGTYRVLEDNLRNPSGVSYMLMKPHGDGPLLPQTDGGARRAPDFALYLGLVSSACGASRREM